MSRLRRFELHPLPLAPLVCAAALVLATATPSHAADTHDWPPLPLKHPYVRFIHVLPQQSCDVRDPRICSDDSIAVVIGGTFPNSCYHVQSVELLPPVASSPPPQPPIVRLTVGDQGCTEVACSPTVVPWTAVATIPPLPGADDAYWLVTELVRVLGCPPAPDTTAASTPFTVRPVEYCQALPCTCLTPAWLPRLVDEECQAWIAPGHTTDLSLGVRSPMALGGLEGSLYVPEWAGAGLTIVGLQAVGNAEGMHLDWVPISHGVHFALNAEQGTPIPAMPAGSAAPVLRVTVALAPESTDPHYAVMTDWDVRGLGAQGDPVPMCPPWDMEWATPPEIQLCLEQGGCDFNHDAIADVRDLVLMTRCVTGSGPCPPDPVMGFDCDVSRVYDLGDVACCALAGLRGPACLDCPADSVRGAPEVSLGFAAPLAVDERLEVPLRIEGIERVAGARLRIRFPADRLEVAGVGGDPGWITLHQVEGDLLSIGLIHGALTGDFDMPGGAPLDLALRFTLKPGQRPGGELAVVESDFSDSVGVKLDVPAAQPRLALAGPASVALGVARPNPFAVETRFSVTLDRPGPLEVAIYDLAGRRVAIVFRGSVTAGTHAFGWDGRRADGSAAAGGVYFYRARANGASATRRMVMLQRR